MKHKGESSLELPAASFLAKRNQLLSAAMAAAQHQDLFSSSAPSLLALQGNSLLSAYQAAASSLQNNYLEEMRCKVLAAAVSSGASHSLLTGGAGVIPPSSIPSLMAAIQSYLHMPPLHLPAADLNNNSISSPISSSMSPQHTWSAAAPSTGSTELGESHSHKPKRIRTAFSPSQLIELEEAFDKNQYLVGQERRALARRLTLSETQVKVWFQNRRTKHKRVKPESIEHQQSLHLDPVT